MTISAWVCKLKLVIGAAECSSSIEQGLDSLDVIEVCGENENGITYHDKTSPCSHYWNINM